MNFKTLFEVLKGESSYIVFKNKFYVDRLRSTFQDVLGGVSILNAS